MAAASAWCAGAIGKSLDDAAHIEASMPPHANACAAPRACRPGRARRLAKAERCVGKRR
jgi:hypothetical protein